MLMRILATGLVAGALAGGIVAGLQHVTTTPLIIQAEAYETPVPQAATPAGQSAAPGLARQGASPAPAGQAGAPGAAGQVAASGSAGQAEASGHGHSASTPAHSHDAATPAHSHDASTPAHSHGGDGDEWAPEDGIERTAYTALATVSTGVGFALILLAVMVASGAAVTARTGALWAAGAFIATGLAPALGLPPELPGSAAAELINRQLWWIATALATGIGLWLITRAAGALTVLLGIALIVAPHVIGAPHPHEFKSGVPAELAGHFTASSLVVHAVLWALVGTIAGFIWQRAEARSAAV